MAETANSLKSYDDESRKDDVLGLVEILTATENWFLTNLGKTAATDTIHQTLVDTLRTAASAAVRETDEMTALVRTTPTRLSNYIENVSIPFKVGRTQQRITKHTGENELTRQTTKALKDWGNAAEFDLVRSTLTSGLSGTAPKMSGILEAISKSTTVTAHNSGATFAASVLKGLMKLCWDNSNGDVPTDVFVGSYLKTIIDGFTAGQTKYMLGKDAKLTDYIDVYDSGGFGRVRIHTHRYVQQSGDATGRVLGVRPEKLKIAYLKRPGIDDLARLGDYDFRMVYGQLTLEVRNQDCHVYATGLDID